MDTAKISRRRRRRAELIPALLVSAIMLSGAGYIWRDRRTLTNSIDNAIVTLQRSLSDDERQQAALLLHRQASQIMEALAHPGVTAGPVARDCTRYLDLLAKQAAAHR